MEVELTELTELELKVYELAIIRGYITADMVFKAVSKKAEPAIKSLEEKGFLKKIPGIVPRYFAITPLKSFIKKLGILNTNLDKVYTEIKDFKQIEEETTAKLNSDTEVIIKDAMKGIADKASEKRKATIDKFNNELGGLEKEITVIIEKTNTNVKNSEKPILDQLNKNSKESLKVADESVNIEINDKSLKFQEILSDLKKNLEIYKDKLTRGFSSGETELDKEIAVVKKDLAELTKNLAELTKNSYANINQIIQENVENSTNSVSQAYKNAEDVSKSLINSVLKNSGASLSLTKTETEKTISASHLEISNAKEQIISTLASTHKSLKDNIQTGLKDLMSGTTTKTTALKTVLKNKNEELIKNSITEINSQTLETKNDFLKIIGSGIDIFRDGGTILKEIISNSIQEEVKKYQTEVAEALAKIQQEYLSRIELAGQEYEAALKNKVNNKIVDIRVNLKKNMDDVTVQSDKNSLFQEKIYTDFGNNIGVNIEETSDSINNDFRKLFQENSDSATKSFDDVFSENNTITEGSISGLLTILSSLNEKLSKQISSAQESLKSGLTSESEKLTASVDERILKLKEIADNTLTNQNKIVSDSIAKTTEEIRNSLQIVSSSVDRANNTIKESIQGFITGVNPNIENLPTKVEEILSPLAGYLEKILITIKDSFSDATNKELSSISSALESSSSEINEFLGNFNKSVKDSFSNSQKAISNGFESLGKLTKNAIVEIETSLKDKNSEIQTNVFNKISEISNSVQSIIKSGMESTSKPIEILEETWNKFLDSTLFDSEKTWIIVGHEEILDYVNDMIGRVKSSGFILVPKSEDLNWKEIMKIHKKGRKFVICTQLETADPKIIEDAVDSGIDVYSYTNKDFICFYRDQEEIVIAAISQKEDETTAIISEITPLIKHFSSMFNDYWRRNSKKYMPR